MPIEGDRADADDRLGRHVDARQAGAASELRVHVDEVRHDSRRSRRSRRLVFGETPVNPKACPYMNKIQKGSCAAVPPERAGVVLQQDPLLEDADRTVRLAEARTTAWTTTPGSKPGRRSPGRRLAVDVRQLGGGPAAPAGPPPPLGRALAAAVAEGHGPARPAAGGVLRRLRRRARGAASSRRSGRVDSFTGKLVHHWTLSNYRHHLLARAIRTCASPGARSGSPRPSR